MAGRAPRDQAGRAKAKAAPRTSGTPDKPPRPRKVVAPAKPAKPTRRVQPAQPGQTAKPRARPPVPPAGEAPPPGWLPAEEPALEWIPLPEASVGPTRATQGQTSQPFHPATGAWIPAAPVTGGAQVIPGTASVAPSATAVAAKEPAAYRRGVGSTLMHIVLGLSLGLFALGLGVGIVTGYALIFEPDSARAQEALDQAADTTAQDVVVNSALNLVLFGAVPLAWVAATRVRAHPGTWQYLRLRFQGRDWLRALALVPLMLVAVAVLSSLYTLGTKGPDGFTDTEGENPAVQAMLDNLSWPLALFIALSAGVGEEIFFRGLLQRRIGIWAQSILFGLAHAASGYLPQILFATGLGIAFGFLYRRGWSLASLIVAHFLYDFVLLALALVFPEFG